MSEKEQLAKYLAEVKHQEHGETLTILDALRKSRKSRSGSDAPLEQPRHLSEARQTIILTDAIGVEKRG